MRGRPLYRRLARESADNARRLLLDSRTLRHRGSRGHACSLAVLAIEEGSKAVVYYLAGEGVYRIVRLKPNNVSTFSEEALLDHRFKHGLVATLLLGAIQFAPFRETLASTRRKTFTREQVEKLFRAAHTRQQLQAVRLQRPSRASRAVTGIFQTLERLNALKNDGLYVGHSKGNLKLPNALTAKDRARVEELGEVVVQAAIEMVRTPISSPMRRELADKARAVAAQVILAKKTAAKEPTGTTSAVGDPIGKAGPIPG